MLDFFQNTLSNLVAAGIGAALLFLVQRGWRWYAESKGIFTGEWDQLIFDSEGAQRQLQKQDKVVCRQRGEHVQADIQREKPNDQRHREWRFDGRYKNGQLFGHFWSRDPGDPSMGTIFLRQTKKDCYTGFYHRLGHAAEDWSTDKVSIQHIPLEWRRRQ